MNLVNGAVLVAVKVVEHSLEGQRCLRPLRQLVRDHLTKRRENLCELVTSDVKLKASREG